MNQPAMNDDTTPDSRAEVAEHIALEASRLMRLAVTNNFSMLAYLIDMAVLEAWREASESAVDKEGSLAAGLQIDGT
jgi:hypothetical protein